MFETLIIADDHEIITQGLRDYLTPHFKTIKCCSNGQDLISLIKENQIGCLILDLNIPGANGIEVLKFIVEKELSIKTIVLTMYNEVSLVEKCRKLGASAYLLKTCSNEDVLDALNSDGFVYGHGVKNISEIIEFNDGFLQSSELTSREIEVIRYLAKDLNSQEIADILFVSQHTINTHRRNLKKKLKVSTTAGIIAFGYENQLIID